MSKVLPYELQCPTTRQALHEYVKRVYNLNIPNKKICDHHCSPFKFIADAFFEVVSKAIVIANRGGGKSINLACLNALNMIFKPNCESAILGAQEHQAIRCYNSFKQMIEPYKKYDRVKSSMMKETLFDTPLNTKLEILVGTTGGVNAPHPPKLNIDEFELMEWQVFQEALNIPISKNGIPIQVILASTRKYAYGTVEKLLRSDRKTRAYKNYIWCVWECIEKCEKPSCDECKKIVKGKHIDGSERTFYSVCKEKARLANGYRKIDEDVIDKFRTLDREMWEAQQECSRPSQKGAVFYWFDQKKHVGTFDLDYNGKYYNSIDWGAKDPNVCLFWMVKNGVYYLFDEIYKSNIPPSEFAQLINKRREYWGIQNKIEKTFCDPSGKMARLELAKQGIQTVGSSGNILDGLNIMNSLGSEDRIIIHKRCENSIREYQGYHWSENTTSKIPIGKDDHTIDPSRYLFTKLNPIGYNSGGNLMERLVRVDDEKHNKKEKKLDTVGLFYNLSESDFYGSSFKDLNDIISTNNW